MLFITYLAIALTFVGSSEVLLVYYYYYNFVLIYCLFLVVRMNAVFGFVLFTDVCILVMYKFVNNTLIYIMSLPYIGIYNCVHTYNNAIQTINLYINYIKYNINRYIFTQPTNIYIH